MRKKIIYSLLVSFLVIASEQKLNAQFISRTLDTLKHRRQVKISKTDKYKLFGTSVSFSSIQDTKMTPLIYSGPSIGVNGGVFRTVKKFTHFTNFNAHYVALFGTVGLDSYMQGARFRFNTGTLHKLKSTKWSIGGSTNIELNGRLYPKIGNDMLSSEALATINFAAGYPFEFDVLKRKRTLYILAGLPLFAYSMRYPDYCVDGFKHLFIPIGKYNALRTKFTLITPYKYSNENKYSISYEWDFYTFKENNNLHKLVSGAHFITFSYWLKKM